MELDLAHAPAPPDGFQVQVCVVGGGIAGLTVAHRLVALGIDVLLVESGGRQRSSPGSTAALGGASLDWGGQLLPVADLTGWPISADDLAPYWAQVEALFGVDDLPFEASLFYKAVRTSMPAELQRVSGLVPRLSKFASFGRRNLGASLGRALLSHPRARVLLHAEAVAIELNADRNHARAVRVRDSAANETRIRAQHVLLAAGTRATCDLLTAALGPLALVGPGFHDHLTVELATFHGPARTRALALAQPWLLGGLRGTVHSLKWEAADSLRQQGGGRHAMAHITFAEPEGSGLGHMRELLRSRQGATARHRLPAGALARSARELLLAATTALRSRRRYLSPIATVSLRLNVAYRLPATHPPFAQSADSWQLTATEEEPLRLYARHLHRAFAALGMAEAAGASWHRSLLEDGPLGAIEDARHLMGGATMGDDPRHSVVDASLTVHGVPNLHVASAAVLPDGRAQLPTMTLMALCLRLADRLGYELGRC